MGGAGLGIGALTNALLRAGIVGLDGRPSAALVFGACGGIGFHYAVIGEGRQARVLLDGLANGVSSRVTAPLDAAAALGASVQAFDPLAPRALAARTAAGEAVVAWVDRASLPYDLMPRGYERSLGMLVGVLGYQPRADEFLLDDRAAVPLPVDAERLRLPLSIAPGGATAASLLPSGTMHEGLAPSLLRRLRDAAAAHLGAPLGNRGVAGIRTLARRIRDPGHDHGWRRIFGRNVASFHAHAALYRFIEEGAGPGLARGRMAETVAALGTLAHRPDLNAHAERWEQLARRWTALALLALPDGVGPFAAARALLRRRHAIFLGEGLDASAALASATEELAALTRTIEADFPLTPPNLALLHGELAAALDALATEEAAVTAELLSLCAR